MSTYNPFRFQAIVLANALEFYNRHGTPVNRAFTPQAMMRTASRLTGRSFRSRDYAGAATALRELAEQPREAAQ